jgi:two-component system chemotaxis response regulator CheY
MLSQPSVLITDDDRDFRETLGSILARSGYATRLAEDGEEAVRIVAQNTVHVVLIDLHMPKMSGSEAIRRIVRLNRRLPCILVSGGLDEPDASVPPTAFSILRKPVTRDVVTQTVECALRERYNWAVSSAGPKAMGRPMGC